MSYIRQPQEPPEIELLAEKVRLVNKRSPKEIFSIDDNIPYHASRLLLVLRFAGRPVSAPRIEGRTKFVKLDFFVRYPQFLERAARIILSREEAANVVEELKKSIIVESRMIRYRYGPWDKKYYLVLAYLSGKNLLDIETKSGIDIYTVSAAGFLATKGFAKSPEFKSLITRCNIVGELFGDKTGNWLKDFIYRHYPEVTHAPYYQFITLDKTEN